MRCEVFYKALQTLEKSLTKLETQKIDDYQELRDSIIQRFEYTADTFWKYLKDYLQVKLAIEVPFARPKAVLKECRDSNIITEAELALCINLIEDRNLTSHGYNEEFAEQMSKNIPEYCATMREIVTRLAACIK